MEALVIQKDAAQPVAYRTDYPGPTVGAGEALVRVDLAGVCSTDLELARGYMDFTGVPGHEFVGTVLEGPDELIGKRIVSEINCACGKCDMCRRATPSHCRHRTVLGIAGRDGVFASRVAVPAANCHVVSGAITDEQAVFVEPLAAAVQVVRHCPIDARMRVTIVGSGRMGLLIGQVLARYRCQLTLVGRNTKTLALARKFRLDSVRNDQLEAAADQDVVVECTGSPEGLELAMRLVRPRGTIVLKSTYADPRAIDLSPIVIHEIRLLGNRCGPFPDAIHMLEHGQVDVVSMINKTMPLSAGVAALEAAARPGALKILLKPGKG